MKTLIVGAMISELEEIVNHLNGKKRLNLKNEAYFGKFFGHDLYVLITGVGKVNASMALTEFLLSYQIDQIINIGLVGSSNDLKINSFVYVDKVCDKDFDLTPFGYKPYQVPNQSQYLKSTFPNILKLSTATLYTADRFETNELAVNKPYLTDMEAIAYYQVAKAYNVPIVSYKLISDYVGANDQIRVYEDNENIKSGVRIFNFLKDNKDVLLWNVV